VVLTGPPAVAGKQGTVVGPASDETFAVRFDSGSVFHIAVTNMQDSAATGPPVTCAPVTAPMPANVANPKDAASDEDLEFTAGQQVSMTGPPAMVGKQGTIVGPALNGAFAVRFASSSVFNIAAANLEVAATASKAPAADASAPAPTRTRSATCDEEPEFAEGQRVVLTGPPAVAGKQGTVVGPASDETFAVLFDSGSIFHICTANLQTATAAVPAVPHASPVTTAAPALSSPWNALDVDADCTPAFAPGQRVVLRGPLPVAGRQGTVVGPASGDAFAVRFDSGSIFNISILNIQDAARVPAMAAASLVGAAVESPAAGKESKAAKRSSWCPQRKSQRQGKSIGRPVAASSTATATQRVAPPPPPPPPPRPPPPPPPARRVSTPPATPTSSPLLASPMKSVAPAVTPRTSQDSEFAPGQRVILLSPLEMAGKIASIVGPAPGDAFEVMLGSGRVLNVDRLDIDAMGLAMA